LISSTREGRAANYGANIFSPFSGLKKNVSLLGIAKVLQATNILPGGKHNPATTRRKTHNVHVFLTILPKATFKRDLAGGSVANIGRDLVTVGWEILIPDRQAVLKLK
jgi:hypothetical protein